MSAKEAVLDMPGREEPALPQAVAGPHVYAAISHVTAELAKVGISKGRQNQQQHYAFRGIDDVYNVLAPMLPAAKLVVLPRMLTRDVVERTSKSGTAQFFVTVEAEFDFVSALDGSKHVVRTFGEAQDSGDKATNKAMSAAYKYAAFQTFCIPTEGDNDADATTAEPSEPEAPPGFANWLDDLEAVALEGTPALEKAWKASQPYLRKFLTDTNKQKWEAIKATAAAQAELS